MTTVTVNEAFEEDAHNEKGKTKVPLRTSDDGPAYLNAHTQPQVKNGATKYNNQNVSKSRSVLSRITKDTLFGVFLLLLILALLIPILILVALIYNQSGSYPYSAGSNRISANPDSSNTVAGEETGVPNAKNEKEYRQQMEEIYKKEPWRRDPTSAWKQIGTSLADSVDPRGDACSDFFAYSCDQWRDRHPLDGHLEISGRRSAYENVKAVVLQTFDGMKKDSSSWPSSVRWAKNFYDRCASVDDSELAERKKSVVLSLSNIFSTSSSSAFSVPPPSQPIVARRRRSAAGTTEGVELNHDNTSSVAEGHRDIDFVNSTLSNLTEAIASNVAAAAPSEDNGTTPMDTTANAVIGREENETTTTEAYDSQNVTLAEATLVNETETNRTTEETISDNVTETPQAHLETPAPTREPEGVQDIWKLASAISEAGVVSFFDIDFSKDPKDSTNLRMILRPPSLSLPGRRYYLKRYLSSKHFPILEKSIINTVKSLKTSPGAHAALFPDDQATARGVIQFEEAIAKASPTANPAFEEEDDFDFDELQTRVPTARRYSLSSLTSRWPRINWDAFLPDEAKKGANESSESNETTAFIVTDPAYIDQLVGVLEDYDRPTVVNFLKWRYIYAVADYLRADDNLNTTCYKALEDNMPLALAHVLYKSDYGLSQDEKSKVIYTPESIQFLFNRTVRAFNSVLEFSVQVENASKKSIIQELSNQILTTEWPNFVKDGNSLDSLYADNVQIPDNVSFIEMLNALHSSSFLDDAANAWSDAIPDAFVSVRYIARPTIAMVYSPRVLNSQFSQAAVGQFATVGWQLARELAKSVRYSPKTPLQNSKIDQCLVDQYNQFCYQPPINSCVDGASTLEENFADVTALQVAFKAYKTWESVTATSRASDAFPAFLAASNLGKFTLDQIFLLAYGSSFCNNAENQYIIDWLAAQQTPPDADRLRGAVQDLNDFQLAFHCKAGDKIYRNPKERCQL